MDSARTPPFFVRLLERPEVLLGEPIAQVSDEYDAWKSDPNAPTWSVEWTPPAEGQDLGRFVAQLGGEAQWVQGDETPTCPVCDERMDFVAALPAKSNVFDLYLGLGWAVVYGFWCGRCRVTATRLQAS